MVVSVVGSERVMRRLTGRVSGVAGWGCKTCRPREVVGMAELHCSEELGEEGHEGSWHKERRHEVGHTDCRVA